MKMTDFCNHCLLYNFSLLRFPNRDVPFQYIQWHHLIYILEIFMQCCIKVLDKISHSVYELG